MSDMLLECNETSPWRPLGKMLDLYVLPIICAVGLLLNTACLIVFTQRRSHPLVPALILLSICDSLQLLFSIFVLYLPALHDHMEMDPLGWVAQIAYIATGTLAGGLLASNCASIWTMCYISIQRHRAIVKPLSTVSKSKSANHGPLFIIALCSILFNIPVWFEFSWSVERIADEDGSGRIRTIIWHTKSLLSQSESYNIIMHKVLYPVAVYLIPLILISVLNMRILTYIALSNRLHSSAIIKSNNNSNNNHNQQQQCLIKQNSNNNGAIHNGNNSNCNGCSVNNATTSNRPYLSQKLQIGHKQRMAKERRSVMLLISIVLLFFLCHTGGLIIRFVDFREYGNMPCFVFAKDFVNFLFNINSFANPMLYFFFTKQFKDLRTTWSNSSMNFGGQGSFASRKRIFEQKLSARRLSSSFIDR